MTCAHVLNVIDAGPFAQYPQQQLDAAHAHARGCPTCGPALALSTALAADVATLPEPESPADLTGIVMARIAQVPESDSAPVRASARRRRDWTQALTALGGLVAGLALIVTMPFGADAVGGLLTPRLIAAGALATMPSSGPAALAIGLGLLLYLAGLFAPVRTRS